jgi:hypothetical protein
LGDLLEGQGGRRFIKEQSDLLNYFRTETHRNIIKTEIILDQPVVPETRRRIGPIALMLVWLFSAMTVTSEG